MHVFAACRQEERHGYSTSHMQPYARRGSDEGGAEISSDEALAWAVRLADMTPHAQEQQLSQVCARYTHVGMVTFF